MESDSLKTEQLDSSIACRDAPGRDAALRRPLTHYLDAPLQDSPGVHGIVPARRASFATWLNLVCLDAPLVSVTWLCLFTWTFHFNAVGDHAPRNSTVHPAHGTALFLTAWLIYLADRFADSCSLPSGVPHSLRHEFCRKHRMTWIGALAVVVITDAWLVWLEIDHEILGIGSVIGILSVIYLVINHWLGGNWRRFPSKEIAVGTLFAAGTLVPLLSTPTWSLVFSGIAFACLGTLNCISIAYWERQLDLAQEKVSFATRYPGFDRHWGKLLSAFGLCFALVAILYRGAMPVFGCASASALLLAALDFSRARIDRDQRTALADIVLLTPIPVLLVMSM